MWAMSIRGIVVIFGLLLVGSGLGAVETGFGAGADPDALQRVGVSAETTPWLRVGGVGRTYGSETRLIAMRSRLEATKEEGFKVVCLVNWANSSWQGGARGEQGHHLPVDLMEAYERCRFLGRELGDVVSAWEIDNEPDIFFVRDPAQVYASYLKACYLGFRAGDAERGDGRLTPVWMAPLALPPGPFFQQLVDNDFWRYTDAFNYHFYGYADDFTGMCLQWERALEDTDAPEVPRVITEYGYGLLPGEAAGLTEARLEQRDWFKRVLAQMDALPVDAAMAFVLMPYLEAPGREFGLTQNVRREGLALEGLPTPALDYLNTRKQEVAAQRSYAVRDREVSPVVLDLVPDESWTVRDSGGGYLVSGWGPRRNRESRLEKRESSQRSELGEKADAQLHQGYDGQDEEKADQGRSALPADSDGNRTRPCFEGGLEATLVVYNFSEEDIRGRIVRVESPRKKSEASYRAARHERERDSQEPGENQLNEMVGEAYQDEAEEVEEADRGRSALPADSDGIKVTIPEGIIEVGAMSAVRVPVSVYWHRENSVASSQLPSTATRAEARQSGGIAAPGGALGWEKLNIRWEPVDYAKAATAKDELTTKNGVSRGLPLPVGVEKSGARSQLPSGATRVGTRQSEAVRLADANEVGKTRSYDDEAYSDAGLTAEDTESTEGADGDRGVMGSTSSPHEPLLQEDGNGLTAMGEAERGRLALPWEEAPGEPDSVLSVGLMPYDPSQPMELKWRWQSPKWSPLESHPLPWKRLPEEPVLLRSSVGWATRGVMIDDRKPGAMTLHISHAPEVPLHPTRVELALPADFNWQSGEMLVLRMCAPGANAPENAPRVRVGVRCASGQVYGLWQRPAVGPDFADYAWVFDEMTPQFYSRAQGESWRFEDQEPVAIVLHVYPQEYPAEVVVEGVWIQGSKIDP